MSQALSSATKLEEVSSMALKDREALIESHADAMQRIKDDFELALKLKDKELALLKESEESLAGVIARMKKEAEQQTDLHRKQQKEAAEMQSTLQKEVGSIKLLDAQSSASKDIGHGLSKFLI
jgi:hypothetical protein